MRLTQDGAIARGWPRCASPRGDERRAPSGLGDGLSPKTVAEAIVAAATDVKPKPRYTASPTAGRARLLRRVAPAQVFDKQIHKMNSKGRDQFSSQRRASPEPPITTRSTGAFPRDTEGQHTQIPATSVFTRAPEVRSSQSVEGRDWQPKNNANRCGH